MSLICMSKKSHFHRKGWAPRLALRKRLKVIRKWPITKKRSYIQILHLHVCATVAESKLLTSYSMKYWDYFIRCCSLKGLSWRSTLKVLTIVSFKIKEWIKLRSPCIVNWSKSEWKGIRRSPWKELWLCEYKDEVERVKLSSGRDSVVQVSPVN